MKTIFSGAAAAGANPNARGQASMVTSRMRRGAAGALGMFLMAAGRSWNGGLLAQRAASPVEASTGALEVLQLRPTFYVISGAGGNIGVQIGQDGAIVVDAGTADRADEVVAAIKELSDRPHAALRIGHRPLDDEDVCRGGVQKSQSRA